MKENGVFAVCGHGACIYREEELTRSTIMGPSKALCLTLHHSRKLRTWEVEGCNSVLRHYYAMHLD